jgi:hypothetical protein
MVDDANLRTALANAGGTVGCNVCGVTDLDTFESVLRLEPVDDAGGAVSRGGLEVLTMICPTCSAIQLYSYPHLKRLAEQQSK